ncbi:MAG: class II glutamine amidotransferase [Bacteroidota bacterium]|nr:class II glutamine amidotransferase [Bacteroidota bacterium]
MSDQIKHECGIAVVRLLKPLSFYKEKYGTAFYGVNKMYLLMEKQHNRGQDGAGLANIKLDVEPGNRYISRHRSNASQPIVEVFNKINNRFSDAAREHPDKMQDPEWLKNNLPFTGELFLGHLRYGTYGKNSVENCHPFLRQNNWMTRNLVVAGNFNLTNVDELLDQLLDLGQHPKEKSDTVTVLEKIGHFLDEENELLFKRYKQEGFGNKEISSMIAANLDIQRILTRAAKSWDGGYVIAGLIGHGDAFVMRDPNGIRPAWYYVNDEVAVVASERPAIQTAFNVPSESLIEIKPGHALVIRKNGKVEQQQFREPQELKSCSFERIYFSRGSDVDIYKERKELGRVVCPEILEAVDYDLKNTVFSFVPNTAESAFYGMVSGIEGYLRDVKKRKILKAGAGITEGQLDEILSIKPRIEKIAIKDAKLRTFITDDAQRNDLVAHVYDITYGTVKRGEDNLVIIDDSIVRGTTLKKSILKMLDRLEPKKIIIVSSAPQIRYPDCYGIDMAKLGDFVAFAAAIELLEENNMEHVIEEVYHKCLEQQSTPTAQMQNFVKDIYKPFTAHQISERIAKMIRPKDIKAEVQIIFQKIEDLHTAIPNHTGDWYFSGNYPTPGGNKVVCKSFINYMKGNNERAY